MTAIQQVLFRRMCKTVLMTLIMGCFGLSTVHAQSSGPTVNTCSSGVVDSSYGVEETVCLYGNQSTLNASAEVDNGGGGSGAANWVGVDATLLKSSTSVWNSGDVNGGTYESVSGGVVPTVNIWYTLTSTFDEGVCNYGGCNSWYGMGGLSVSAEVTASAPSAPTSLAAQAGGGQVALTWTASAGATSYNVYQGTSSGAEGSTPIATGITTTSFNAAGLSNGTTYYFKVAAVNPYGTSGYSNEASGTPQLPAPTDLGATAGNQQVLLSWVASTGATSYNVYQGTYAGGEGSSPVASGITSTAFAVTGLANGPTYYFKVIAIGVGSSSGYSNEASAVPSGSTPNVYNYSVSYDGVGNVTGYTDSVNGTWTMTSATNSGCGNSSSGYDCLNRLVGAKATAGPYQNLQVAWGIDNFGNRSAENFSGSPAGSVPVPASTSLSFNANNQVTSSQNSYPPHYDAAGNVTCDTYYASSQYCLGLGNQYLYDGEGRLCAVSTSSGMYQYLYDAEGNRIAKGTISQLSCDTTVNGFALQASYVVDPGGQQLSEIDYSSGYSPHWNHTNVWAGGQLVATYSINGSQAALNFEFNDWLGTRRILTDSAGNNQQTCHSLPYGNGEDCIPTPTEHLFTQKERDSETNNDYFDARYYASSMGRFLAPDWAAKLQGSDPVPYAKLDNPQSLNLYEYVLDNPLIHADADGHQCGLGGTSQCSQAQQEAGQVPQNPGGTSNPENSKFLQTVKQETDGLTKPAQPVAEQIDKHDVQVNASATLLGVTKSTDGSTSYTPAVVGASIDTTAKFSKDSGEDLGEVDYGTSKHTSVSVSFSQNSDGGVKPSGVGIHVGAAFPDTPVSASATGAGIKAFFNTAVQAFDSYVTWSMSHF